LVGYIVYFCDLLFQAKAKEIEAIKVGIKENGEEDTDKVVRVVLAQRQAQETADLEKRFALEKKVMIDDALDKLAKEHEAQRSEIAKKHEAELAALEVEYLLQ